MQFKISSFFKPSPTNNPDSSKLFDDPIEEEAPLFNTTIDPEIRITYTRRRTPKPDLSRVDETVATAEEEETNNAGSNDDLVKPVSNFARVINKKRSYTQFHLEMGQTDFILHNCVCGLKYAPGVKGDEDVHKEFHKTYTLGIPFKGWRIERVVPTDLSDLARIILVLDSDPSAQKNKVHEVARMMEGELGLSEGWLLHKLCKVYLLISAKRIAGCLVVEPIQTGYRLILNSADEKSSNCSTEKVEKSVSTVLQFGTVNFRREVTKRVNAAYRKELSEDHNEAICCEEEAVPAVCGIRAIWVSPSNRRRHFATMLLDAARASFCTGYVLEHSQLAFSQPTSVGKAFALNYNRSGSFLVYNTGLHR